MKTIKKSLFALLMMYAIFPAQVSIAGVSDYTIVKGNVSGIWTKDKSPYLAAENIVIADGDKLVIEPGVTVYFAEDVTFSIGVETHVLHKKYPQLIAKGTEKDSIIFTALNKSNGWEGFRFHLSSNNDTISYAVINNARKIGKAGQGGYVWDSIIGIQNSSPYFSNSKICDNYVSSNPLVSLLDQTSSWSSYSLERSAPVFINCVFTNNTCPLDWLSRGPLFTCGNSTLKLENALIYNNNIGHLFDGGDGSLIYCNNSTISKNIFIFNGHGPFSDGEGPKYIFISNSIMTENQADFHSLFCSFSEDGQDSLIIEYSNIDTTVRTDYDHKVDGKFVREKVAWLDHPLIKWGPGNLSTDPLFTDPDNFDFTLQTNSPCIDAGNPNNAYSDIEDPDNPDFALLPSKGTLRNDMGVYGGNCTIDIPQSSPTSIAEKTNSSVFPERVRLMQNYPNPFNPETIIAYSLPTFAHVKISVIDAMGRQIKTLVNSMQSQGQHQTVWDGQDAFGKTVSSGVYFYRIVAGEHKEVRRMTLMR